MFVCVEKRLLVRLLIVRQQQRLGRAGQWRLCLLTWKCRLLEVSRRARRQLQGNQRFQKSHHWILEPEKSSNKILIFATSGKKSELPRGERDRRETKNVIKSLLKNINYQTGRKIKCWNFSQKRPHLLTCPFTKFNPPFPPSGLK